MQILLFVLLYKITIFLTGLYFTLHLKFELC